MRWRLQPYVMEAATLCVGRSLLADGDARILVEIEISED